MGVSLLCIDSSVQRRVRDVKRALTYLRADELKRRHDFVAGRRHSCDDVTMTSRQAILPDDMSGMTSLCCDDDDVSVCLQIVGSPRFVYLLTVSLSAAVRVTVWLITNSDVCATSTKIHDQNGFSLTPHPGLRYGLRFISNFCWLVFCLRELINRFMLDICLFLLLNDFATIL